MSLVLGNRSSLAAVLCTGVSLALLALAGCTSAPDYSAERTEVRAIHRNNARIASQPETTAMASKGRLRPVNVLGEDDYRQVRYAMAKPVVTPQDAARLPYGSNLVLMRFLHDPRFRRYGPALVNLLAMTGGEAELTFLRDYLENEVRGGIDEFTYRTLLTIPSAIGYLAVHNDHAYATLRDYLRLQFWRENIQWRFAAKDRDLNAYRLVMAALDGIAISGRRSAIPYVEYIIQHECGADSGRTEGSRTLMDERLEAQARQTVASLSAAQ